MEVKYDFLAEKMPYSLELKHGDKTLVKLSNDKFFISSSQTLDEIALTARVTDNFRKIMEIFEYQIDIVEKMIQERDVILSGGTNGSEFANKKPE